KTKDNDIDALNSSSETLLHVAAANGHLTIMEYLISKGAKTDVKDRKGRTPLHRAAEKGHGDAVKVLLRHGAYMYSLDMEGKTPLHLAAQNNHGHIVKMILKEEARSYRNKHNFLHMAALKDESSLAKTLLKAGASTEGKDERGQTALSYAVSQGSENTAKVLLEAGASVDSNMAERAFNSNHPSIFKILLEYSKDLAVQKNLHASFGIKTPASDTALHLAVQAGAASLTNLLLHKGMGINLRNQADETPLHVAALHNQGALVGLLVNAGAQINAVTQELVTPLHIASQRGNTDVAQQLLHHKADVNVKDKQSKSPLHFAAERGDKTTVEILLNANADPNAQDKEKKTPLHTAAVRGHLSIVKVLLAKKGRFGAKDMDGCTPMHYAAIKGNTEIVKILLTSGKNKNIDDRNIWRKTALHISAEHGHSDLINLLLSHGAAINALDSSKDTPLHCACKAGHFNAANSLINWSQGEKANLLAANSLKKTPLQVAESNKTENQAQIVTLLKKKIDCSALPSAQPRVPALGCMCELIQLTPQLDLNKGEKQGSKELKSTGCPEGNTLSAWFMLILVLLSELTGDQRASPCKLTSVGLLYSRFTRPRANKSYQEAWYKPTRGVLCAQNFADTTMLFSGRYYVLH
uniref:Ankyrin 3 n=1 Tax=Strix occidentalis caurina TaxID=311401 RepID=A0A8D0KYA7_STROC